VPEFSVAMTETNAALLAGLPVEVRDLLGRSPIRGCSSWRPTRKTLRRRTTKFGTALDAADVRRDFRTAMRGAEGINPKDWTPRELRHSFVSLLSDNGLPIDEIARLVGHSSSAVTELVYRQQIRPVVQSGAVIMDRIFDVNEDS
jgi:integrase